MSPKIKRLLIRSVATAALVLVLLLAYSFGPKCLVACGREDLVPAWRRNPYSRHCANCSSFVIFPLQAYAEAHGGAFPSANDATLVADLSTICNVGNDVGKHVFTGGLNGHHDRDNIRSAFAYINGLRLNDTLPIPEDLRGGEYGFEYGPILFYLREPTMWECEKHKMSEPGRVVLTTNGTGRFRFLPEPIFQRALTATRELIDRRTRNQTGPGPQVIQAEAK